MKIKELLNSESKWTQRVFARNKHGANTRSDASDAVSWCLIGACNKCYVDPEVRMTVIQKLRNALPKRFDSLPQFNDTVTFRRVKSLLQRANV